MPRFARICSCLKWLVLLNQIALMAADDSRCAPTSLTQDERLQETARQTCRGLSASQVVMISMAITVATLLVIALFVALYRVTRRRSQHLACQLSSPAWLSRRARRRPKFQPLGTPVLHSIEELKLPEKAVCHI
ncbi:hypothetical protein VP01_822g2 [Puccinia sorghi]|uniref:Uncharacterized protein n=1 Tax=Puccinia sorghi TaxID=27349 RepID=A0A0L6U9Y3_9BASI|nr:hypothetical protein VP01_822g2 [Puccinia sorghi]